MGWEEGEEKRGCSSVFPPPMWRKKRHLTTPPSHSHGSYYGRLQLRGICSATNNGARPRVSDLRPIPSPVVHPSSSSSSSSCPLPLSCDLSVICVHDEPQCMCPPRFAAVVPPVPAPSPSRAHERRVAAAERAAAPRCHRAAHFFLSVRSAGCCPWALRLRILSAAGYFVVGEDNGGRMKQTRILMSRVWKPFSSRIFNLIVYLSTIFFVCFDTMESVEKECGALGGLFQAIVNDMKVTHKLK